MKQSPQQASSRMVAATPFFYGWVVVVAGTIGLLMMGPSQTFTFSLFTDFFVAELGVSRSNISLIYGLSTLGASLMLPFAGRMVDRYGPRRTVVITSAALALSCVWMSQVHSVLGLLTGLLGLRFFGFGWLQIVSNTLIAQWFIRRRGLVMGLAGQSLGLGLLIFPPLGDWLIRGWGWRQAWVWLGLLVVGVMIPLGWGFYRDAPERYGLLPDGDQAGNEGAAVRQVTEENWTLAEARRTPIFWATVGAFTVMTMLTAGIVFHQIALFAERNMDRSLAVLAFQLVALFTVVGNLGMGRLVDRISPRWATAGALWILAGVLIVLQTMSRPAHALLFASLMGLVGGSYRVLDATVWAKYYGRLHLGSIRGATMIGAMTGTALGAYPLGLSHDLWGSFAPALRSLLVLPITMSVVLLMVGPPTRKVDQSHRVRSERRGAKE